MADKGKVSRGRLISLFGYFVVLEKDFFDFALNPYSLKTAHLVSVNLYNSVQTCG